MTIQGFARLLPAEARIVLADVGSAGGLHKRWKPVASAVEALLFEPREGGEVRREGHATTFPIALGAEAGKATLNITALPNMSSTLRPNAALLGLFRKKPVHTRIVETAEMPVDTLDAVVSEHGIAVDAIKVDTQGSELGVLKGAHAALRHSIVIAEVEVSFFQRYENQPTLCDIAAFMAAHDFALIDLTRLKRYRYANAEGIKNLALGGGQRAGRLAYGDALFIKTDDALLARLEGLPAPEAEALLLKVLLGLLVYGKPDLAASLYDRLGRFLSEPRKDAAGAVLRRLGRRPYGGILHHVADYLARNV